MHHPPGLVAVHMDKHLIALCNGFADHYELSSCTGQLGALCVTKVFCQLLCRLELCCAGSDASILSIGEALQPLFASTPAPSEEQACAGCMPGVKVVNVTWDGQGQPSKTDTTSQYELTLSGKCNLQSLSHVS